MVAETLTQWNSNKVRARPFIAAERRAEWIETASGRRRCGEDLPSATRSLFGAAVGGEGGGVFPLVVR